MTQLVRFIEREDGTTKRQAKREREGKVRTCLVNPDRVGAVAPSRSNEYTSILVDGHWLHVAHPYQDVLQALGMEA